MHHILCKAAHVLTIDRRNFILYDYVKCIYVLQHHLMPLYPTLSMVQTLRHWSLFFLWFFLQVDIGAHTIGVERCNFFNNRLFNCIRKGNSDSSLNIKNEMPKHMKQHNYRRTGSWEISNIWLPLFFNTAATRTSPIRCCPYD